jgi:hypothetical protein
VQVAETRANRNSSLKYLETNQTISCRLELAMAIRLRMTNSMFISQPEFVDIKKCKLKLIPSDELERAEGFDFEADRQRCMVGRRQLRLQFGEFLNLALNSLRFECDEFRITAFTIQSLS